MAGFFGLFNYEKEGPGISKNAPKKKTFVIFFETFFRNFWKFITLNIIFSLISIPILTNGLASSGLTNITRNTARDKHSFGMSDFFDTIKKNWKQALLAGIINTFVYVILAFDLYFFWVSAKGIMATIGTGICFSLLFIFTVMNYYVWTMMITFKFKLKQIYKNSFKFVFINLKLNILAFVVITLYYAANIAICYFLLPYLFAVLTFELIFYLIFFPCFRFLLVQFCIFPSIKKYIIDPYYAEHPDEDIDKRRDLGIEINENKPSEITEENENFEDDEQENVFED